MRITRRVLLLRSERKRQKRQQQQRQQQQQQQHLCAQNCAILPRSSMAFSGQGAAWCIQMSWNGATAAAAAQQRQQQHQLAPPLPPLLLLCLFRTTTTVPTAVSQFCRSHLRETSHPFPHQENSHRTNRTPRHLCLRRKRGLCPPSAVLHNHLCLHLYCSR